MAGLRIHSVLVTGANRGIGLGLVQHFLGMPTPPQWVFAACRAPTGQRAQELQRLASKHRNLVIIPLEVTDPASIKAAAAQVGEHLGGSGLTLLINNAGMVILNALDNETMEDMTRVYTTNTIGPLLMGQVRPSPELSCPWAAPKTGGRGPASATQDEKLMELRAGAQELEPGGLGQWEEVEGCFSAGASIAYCSRIWSCVCATSMYIPVCCA
uniref:Uncharacterized protein n=1 Tax=Melopsittacus undulatus TaxID=13146 RepID=A0A8V5GNU0_MELUD